MRVQELSVALGEVGIGAAVADDGGVREAGLGVFDVVDVGDLVAGEIGVVAAERDAGAARCSIPRGRG